MILRLLTIFFALASMAYTQDLSGYHAWEAKSKAFISNHRPTMGNDQKNGLYAHIWVGTEGHVRQASAFLGICYLETSLEIQKYQENVGQNTDYSGMHYAVILCELQRQGWIDGSWRKRGFKGKEVHLVKQFFRNHPELGTMLAAERFHWFVESMGSLQMACRTWNQGEAGCWRAQDIRRLLASPKKKRVLVESSIAALEYWQQVKGLMDEMPRQDVKHFRRSKS